MLGLDRSSEFKSVLTVILGLLFVRAAVEPCSSKPSSRVSRNSRAKKYLTENSRISRHLILCGCRVFYDSLGFEGQQKREGDCVTQHASYKCLLLLHMM